VTIVGSVLVRNEDVFVERAIRNAASFCDRIHVLDHMSDDRTWEVLAALADELGHLELRRSRYSGDSHRQLEPHVGTPTWALVVDGDSLYDPSGLATLREELLTGDYAGYFRLRGHVLHCDELDEQSGRASGFLAPPSRTGVSLFNLDAVTAWRGCPERLHGGRPRFRPGYDWQRVLDLTETTDWDSDPLRMLHVCFLRRSSVDPDWPDGRPNLNEIGGYRRGLVGRARRLVRRPARDPGLVEMHRRGRNWKQGKYRRGPRVTVDAAPFRYSRSLA
jgi:Glycosyl transferase family 2